MRSKVKFYVETCTIVLQQTLKTVNNKRLAVAKLESNNTKALEQCKFIVFIKKKTDHFVLIIKPYIQAFIL